MQEASDKLSATEAAQQIQELLKENAALSSEAQDKIADLKDHIDALASEKP